MTEPSDNSNTLLGVLNLSTGQITSLGNTYVSPEGFLFVPVLSAGSVSATSTVTATTTSSSSALPLAYVALPAIMGALMAALAIQHRRSWSRIGPRPPVSGN